MKKIFTLLLFLVFISYANAQLLTWSPSFPQENDAANNIVITLDATKGNQGLLNYTPTNDVYVYIGVITNKSTAPNDWRYVKFPNFNSVYAQALCTSPGANKWQYTITGG